MKQSIIVLIFSVLLFSCGGGGKSGEDGAHSDGVVSQEIPIKIYDEIKVEGAIDLVYEAKEDEAAYLRVEADDNIIPLLDVKVKRNTLNIKARESINPSRFVIYTNSPTLKYIESKGASKVRLKGSISGAKFKGELKGVGDFNADDLVFDRAEFFLKGSGNMKLGGQLVKGKFEISGNGDINAFDMDVEELECKLNGNGDMEVNVSDKLSIEITGNGHLTYKGDPQITKQKIKGAGTVKMK